MTRKSEPCKVQRKEISGCFSSKHHKVGISCSIQEQKEGQCDWITVREWKARHKVGEMGRGHIMYSFASHGKCFGFHSLCNGKPLGSFKQGSKVI